LPYGKPRLTQQIYSPAPAGMGRAARNEFYKTKVTEKTQNKSDKAKRERKNPDSRMPRAQTPCIYWTFQDIRKKILKKKYF